MQYLLVVPLAAALTLSLVYLAALGRQQTRRTAALASRANELGMIFSPVDPYDLPILYAGTALMDAGHSQLAENVSYGRSEGLPLRAFDLRYEVGHGIQRGVRHYHVVVMDFGQPLTKVLMWPEGDMVSAPLDLREEHWALEHWRCRGDRKLARMLRDCLPMRALLGVESLGTNVMLWMPVQRVTSDDDDALDLSEIGRSLRRALSEKASEVSVTRAAEKGRTD